MDEDKLKPNFGLMQTVGPTFDPVASVVAATDYVRARYGKALKMTKLEALKAAQEYVDGLCAEKKPNSYPKYEHVTLAQRVEYTLQVAQFLIEDDE